MIFNLLVGMMRTFVVKILNTFKSVCVSITIPPAKRLFNYVSYY